MSWRVLVTGGAGFLGANLVERLLGQGHAVAVIDNYATGRRDALQSHARLTVAEGSVADAALVDRVTAELKPTHVVHGAAAYKDPDAWAEDVASNVLGTANVVKAAQRAGVQRFVYLQTALGYGPTKQVPIPADHPLRPTTSYAISKVGGERYVAMSGLPWLSLRLANVYGPRNYTGPMPAFYKRLKAGQKCTIVRTRRDFIEVEDFLRLMDKVLVPGAPTGPFNVASGKDCTILEVYEKIHAALGLSAGEPPAVNDPGADDLASLLLDPSLTMTAFDWRPTVPLDVGVKKLVAWFDAHGVGETFTHLRMPKG